MSALNLHTLAGLVRRGDGRAEGCLRQVLEPQLTRLATHVLRGGRGTPIDAVVQELAGDAAAPLNSAQAVTPLFQARLIARLLCNRVVARLRQGADPVETLRDAQAAWAVTAN